MQKFVLNIIITVYDTYHVVELERSDRSYHRLRFLQELSQTLGDDKSISEHLKLPIQRINDYQLLLKVYKVAFVLL